MVWDKTDDIWADVQIRRGFTWLSTKNLPDPAPGKWKRLLVIYRGENEYRSSSAAWAACSAALLKAPSLLSMGKDDLKC